MADRLISLSEPELERALIDLGHHIAYPSTPAMAARVRQEIARGPAPRQSLGAARLRSWAWYFRTSWYLCPKSQW